MVRFALALGLLLAVTSADAQPAKLGPGATVVKTANDNVAKLLAQKAPPAQVIAAVGTFLDVDQLGRAAMVNHWAKLKPNEQADFLKVLNNLIKTNYINAQQANLQYTVDYVGESTNMQGHIVVKTKIKTQKNNRPFVLPVDYVLVKNGSTWMAFDVITDGVGLVANYRQTFDKVIKDKGFSGLMSVMNNKLVAMQTNAPTNAPNPPTNAPTNAPTAPKKTP
jgi:phospholipid transport system substrate-binding protein